MLTKNINVSRGMSLIEVMFAIGIAALSTVYFVSGAYSPASVEERRLDKMAEEVSVILGFCERARKSRRVVGATAEGALIYAGDGLLPARSSIAALQNIVGENIDYHESPFSTPYTVEIQDYSCRVSSEIPGDHSEFSLAQEVNYRSVVNQTSVTFIKKQRHNSNLAVRRMFYDEPNR